MAMDDREYILYEDGKVEFLFGGGKAVLSDVTRDQIIEYAKAARVDNYEVIP
jgi:hypothetical protein